MSVCVISEQEQMSANQSTNLDQTVDRETTGVTGLVMLGCITFCFVTSQLSAECSIVLL